MNQTHSESDPLHPHSHDPNPKPPSADPSFVFVAPAQKQKLITLPDLAQLPQVSVPDCYIVSTGHGTTGPLTFSGVTLLEFIQSQLEAQTAWSQVEVFSADGFGNRVYHDELLNPDPSGPVLLSIALDGEPMTREQGVVRMIVPSEKDDALRQVKWIGRIVVK